MLERVQDVPITDNQQLQPGTYFAAFPAPANLLDFLAQRPDWNERITEYVRDKAQRTVKVTGGGVAYLPSDANPQRRVFMLRFETSGTAYSKSGVSTMQVVTVPLAVIVTAVLVVLGIGGLIALKRSEPGDDQTLAGKIQSVAELNRSKAYPVAAVAALLFAAYLLVREL